MTPLLSLAYLTSARCTPPEALSLAENLGYGAVGLRLLPASSGVEFSPLIENKALLKETQSRIKAIGIGILDVEIVRLDAGFHIEAFRPFLDVCGALGAQAVLVAGDDPDESRLTQSFAEFCDAANPYGLTANLEFMPWTEVPDAKSALRVVVNAGKANGRILVDALHVSCSHTTLVDLAAIPSERLSYAQACDANSKIPKSNEEHIRAAQLERLLPGEGDIGLVEIFAQLPREIAISVEIPNVKRMRALGIREWARQALQSTMTMLAHRDTAIRVGASLRERVRAS